MPKTLNDQERTAQRSANAIAWAAAVALVGCATQAANEHVDHASDYQGTCALVGIEEVPAPVDQTGDSVVLIARYRFGEGGHTDSTPWTLAFQVARDRSDDLRRDLEARPTVLCNPDHDAAGGDVRRIGVEALAADEP